MGEESEVVITTTFAVDQALSLPAIAAPGIGPSAAPGNRDATHGRPVDDPADWLGRVVARFRAVSPELTCRS